MAFNYNEFGKKLELLFENIAKAIPEITQTNALTAKALLVHRIREQGLTAEETAFPVYSKAYKKRKQKEGHDVGFTNLSNTNRMLNNLQIVATGRDSGGYFVDINAKSEEEVAKLGYNEDHYHNILGMTKKEEVLLAEDFDTALEVVIAENGFGK